jgi:actin-related protein 9
MVDAEPDGEDDDDDEPTTNSAAAAATATTTATTTTTTTKPSGSAGTTTTAAAATTAAANANDEPEYEEDRHSDEGAVYPLRCGRVINWPCFLALLTHVHDTLSPPFHTPLLVVAQPAWTQHDRERVTRFCFEKFKTPAFCLLDAALAACYALGAPAAALVVDVGFDKCDVSAIVDFLVCDVGRGVALAQCGGEALTQRLLQLLGPRGGWTRDMCEQLKRSSICEVLPRGVPFPSSSGGGGGGTDTITTITTTTTTTTTKNAAAAGHAGVAATAGGGAQGQGITPASRTTAAAADDASAVGADIIGKPVETSDGVLDVASIVASGKTTEFLARKEREKAEKAAKKAGHGHGHGGGSSLADAAHGAKTAKMPNAKREKNTFVYETRRQLPPPRTTPAVANGGGGGGGSGSVDGGATSALTMTTTNGSGPLESTKAAATAANANTATTATSSAASTGHVTASGGGGGVGTGGGGGRGEIIRQEVEVGIERFRAADGGILTTIADAVFGAISAVDVNRRAELWDNLIIVGNGSKLRGKTMDIFATLRSQTFLKSFYLYFFPLPFPPLFLLPLLIL